MTKKISVSPAPYIENIAAVYFNKGLFDVAIEQNGYDVIIERALFCPCRSNDSGCSQLSDCKNCGGSGWVFLNKIKTRAILHSINISNQYQQWTYDNVGSVSITIRDTDRIAEMDRITVLGGESEHSEVIFPTSRDSGVTAYVVYEIKKVRDAYLFINSSTPLKRLKEGVDFSFSNNKITLNEAYQYHENLQLTVRYVYAPTFHVIDILRETMVNKTRVEGINLGETQFPIHAIGRRSHNIKGLLTNADVFDNSDYSNEGGCK